LAIIVFPPVGADTDSLLLQRLLASADSFFIAVPERMRYTLTE